MTKTYEEVRRGTLAELADWAAATVRGELTVVVGGAPAVRSADAADPAALAAEVSRREAAGADRKASIAAVARAAGVPKRVVYDAVLRTRDVTAP